MQSKEWADFKASRVADVVMGGSEKMTQMMADSDVAMGATLEAIASRSSRAARRDIVCAAQALLSGIAAQVAGPGSLACLMGEWPMLNKDSVTGAILIAAGGWIAWRRKAFPNSPGWPKGRAFSRPSAVWDW